jgi:ribosomal protein S18 acetylase RimI-like enzyme
MRPERVREALPKTFATFFDAVPGGSFELRRGHARILFPAAPLPTFNGAIVFSESCTGVSETVREVEEAGLPCGIQLEPALHTAVEAEATAAGFTERMELPGMTVMPDELRDARAAEVEITRIEDEADLADGATLCATSFGMPYEWACAMYVPELLERDEIDVYLGRIDGEAVTTALSCRLDSDVGIFNVATPEQHRRRGYGAAITAHACREAFDRGADMAWLQTSPLGEPVYRGLGFEHTLLHVVLMRPSE